MLLLNLIPMRYHQETNPKKKKYNNEKVLYLIKYRLIDFLRFKNQFLYNPNFLTEKSSFSFSGKSITFIPSYARWVEICNIVRHSSESETSMEMLLIIQ